MYVLCLIVNITVALWSLLWHSGAVFTFTFSTYDHLSSIWLEWKCWSQTNLSEFGMTRIRKELKILRQKKKDTDQLGKLFLFFCIISRSLLIVFVRLSLADLEFSPWFLWRVEGKEKNRTGKRLHAQIKFMSRICDVYYIILYYMILYYIRLYYLINLCCLCICIFRPTKTYFLF